MKLENLTGLKFGSLTVIAFGGRRKNETLWECVCDCGGTKTMNAANLKISKHPSCGCKTKEQQLKHGMSGTPTHRAWKSMKNRVLNKDGRDYADYGGRGIKICERWLSFENFYSDMGERPGKCSIDRIDVDGDYCPDNCRWATAREQCRNKRNTKKVLYQGKLFALADLCELLYKNFRVVRSRIKYGWTIERALSEPVRGK